MSVSPTYSGCPAVLAIELAIEAALLKAGFKTSINRVLSPPWTTDWISEDGRNKLKDYGIAPPVKASSNDTDRSYLRSAPFLPCLPSLEPPENSLNI